MTQGSMPWNDQGGGDGDPGANHFESPYNATEWHGFWGAVLGSNSASGFVIPGIGSNYTVTERGAGANMSVDVASGEALVDGARAKSSATENLTITAADATNPRIDRVILRVTRSTTQTVRLAVLTGTPAASPALPSLTQNATTFEVDLAQVYVPALSTSVIDERIADKRVFLANYLYAGNTLNNVLNINSEFMAFSRLSTVPSSNAGAPDGWDLVGTVSWAGATKPAQMSRGRAVQITAGAGTSGMSQTVRVKASTTYVIKGLINVTAGDQGFIQVTTNSAAPGTILRYIQRTGSWLEETIFYTTEADATTLTLSMGALNNTDIVQVGQLMIVEGFIPGDYRQVHESIIFHHPIGDSNWDQDTKSSGTTTIDLDTDFQGLVQPGVRSLYMVITARDSASAAASVSVSLRAKSGTLSTTILSQNSQPNAVERSMSGVVLVDVNNQFDVVVVASGVLTNTVSLRIVGIEI